MHNKNYFELESFKGLYLEDSYVLNIIATPKLVEIEMDFVLTENHPLYSVPKKGEQYYYKRGKLLFINTKLIKWQNSTFQFESIDRNREVDLGNIDVFHQNANNYYLEGDWGNLSIECQDIKVVYDE
jgi:hypothetical protein